MNLNMCVPCLFGLEGLVADELRRLNMDSVTAENGRVFFSGTELDIARANINLRTGERVLLLVGRTPAKNFDMLFEGVKAMDWQNYLPIDAEFPVKGHSLNSGLHSIPDCQRIIKKAVVEKLKTKYHTDWLKENGSRYQIQFSIMNDEACLFLDTSGVGLHKRGYRPVGNAAPLRETLAAAMVKLSRYRGREEFCDPFCGSGTIPVEAALIALNRAPGLNRGYEAMKWLWMEKSDWLQAREEAIDKEYKGTYSIWGGDIDADSIKIATENAKRAGVSSLITFEQAEATTLTRDSRGGLLVCNPPYGERVMDKKEAEAIYRKFGKAFRGLDSWKLYLLSSHTEFERTFGKNATKKRKLYNGMLKCDLFMYF